MDFTDPDNARAFGDSVSHAIWEALVAMQDQGRWEAIGADLRRGWDSAAPTSTAPVAPAPSGPSQPGSGYATEAALRARIADLEAQLAGLRVERIGSAGECVTGDGVRWSVVPGRGPTRADYVFVTVGITEDGDDSNVAGIPVSSLLRACGRSDL